MGPLIERRANRFLDWQKNWRWEIYDCKTKREKSWLPGSYAKSTLFRYWNRSGWLPDIEWLWQAVSLSPAFVWGYRFERANNLDHWIWRWWRTLFISASVERCRIFRRLFWREKWDAFSVLACRKQTPFWSCMNLAPAVEPWTVAFFNTGLMILNPKSLQGADPKEQRPNSKNSFIIQ